jgi:transcriptional regulator GlxA family with amidase domain
MENDSAPLPVVLLTLPESTPAAVYALHEVLGAVGTTWSQVTGEPESTRCRFRPVIASWEGRTIASPAGARIAVEAALGELDPPDIVIVTDLAVDMRSDPRGRWPAEARWVRGCHARGAVVCSICTGSLFLAQAGLLDGAEATTHWAAVPIFRDHFPAVRLEPARIICPTGPEHRIVTAGGASSWADLAL